VLVRAAPLPVLAVDDPGLVRVQLQPDLAHPFLDRRQHGARPRLADAVDHSVVHVTFEPDAGELPGHLGVERVVEEQISEHGRNR